MIRSLACSLCAVLIVTSCDTADAQIVRIGGFGGVSVRAPFVSVDVLPYGGARVRAPFTAVNTGAFGYGPVYYGRRHHHYYPPVAIYDPRPPIVYPAPVVYPPVVYPDAVALAPVAPVVSLPLGDRLRFWASRLAKSLSYRNGDAEVWLDYLGPQLIVDTIDRYDDPSVLRGLVANYDGVVSNGRLASIRSASGFAETRLLLKQFVDQPTQSVAKPAAPLPQRAPDPAPERAPEPAPDPAPEAAPAEGSDLPLPPQPDDRPSARTAPAQDEVIRTASEEQPTPL